MLVKSGIYAIVNNTTGKFYIGSASNFAKRFSNHRDELRLNEHCNNYLQKAWNKYGEADFRFVVLERVPDKIVLVLKEQCWMDWTNCCNSDIGYNLRPLASSNLGYKFSDEFKANASKRQKLTWPTIR